MSSIQKTQEEVPVKRGRGKPKTTTDPKKFLEERRAYVNKYNQCETAVKARARYTEKKRKVGWTASVVRKLDDTDVFQSVIDKLLANPAQLKIIKDKIAAQHPVAE